MGKTRRQKGGVSRWKILAALAALHGANAESLGDLVRKWWNEGGWENSKALADRLTGSIPTTMAIPVPSPAEQAAIVEPYLEESKGRRGEVVGAPEGQSFLNGPVTIVDEEEAYEDEPALWIVEKVIEGNPEQYAIEKQYVTLKGGRKRRKTLRRKK